MNTIISHDPLSAPHLLAESRFSPSRSEYYTTSAMANSSSSSSRKRKASEEPSDMDRMSTSPSASPAISSRPLLPRSMKRTRTSLATGRPLALPRLLETLSAESMRTLLQNICDQHPELQHELVSKAPRPSVDATLAVLAKYEQAFRETFPLGNRPTSDYTYNRVRVQLQELLEAMREFTPHYLPPNETQDSISFSYLDAVTNIIHRLPDWDTYQHQRHKTEAYDEISQAWALVVKEAAKRAGGFHLSFGGWDGKLLEHQQKSGGRLEEAVQELRAAQGALPPSMAAGAGVPGLSEERANIRQQLFSGTYGGHGLGVGLGQW